jgi:methyl-accepting chemotaxis protein
MSDSSKESHLASEDETKISDIDQGNQETLSDRVKEAGQSFKGMITSLSDKAKTIAEKTQELKDKSIESISSTRRDAHDIQALGAKVETVITVFEETMTHIERQEYNEQEKLLNGYKKLLEEQINVIRSRLDLVKRLTS